MNRHFFLRIFFVICGVIISFQIPIGIYNWIYNPSNFSNPEVKHNEKM